MLDVHVGKTCPYCQTPIKPDVEIVVCDKCKIPHHLDCWRENGRCTTYGCDGYTGGTAAVESLAPSSPPISTSSWGDEYYDRQGTLPSFLYIPVTRLILLSILTFGLYERYWIYKNWQYIGTRAGLRISPIWRGIFGIFFCHSLLHRIRDEATVDFPVRPNFSPDWLATGWVAMLIGAQILIRIPLVSAYLLGVLMPTYLCLVPVQSYLNAVVSEQNPTQRYHPWSPGQTLCLVIGLIFWLRLIYSLLPILLQS